MATIDDFAKTLAGSAAAVPVSYTHLDVYKRQDGVQLQFIFHMGSFQDGFGEVIAAAAALAHDMVNAQGIMVDQLLHRGGQVIGRGRGGKAIRGNGQPGAGGVCGGVQHGGNKIPPDAVHPGAAHDQVAVAQRAPKLFARKLAFTIQAFRGGGRCV